MQQAKKNRPWAVAGSVSRRLCSVRKRPQSLRLDAALSKPNGFLPNLLEGLPEGGNGNDYYSARYVPVVGHRIVRDAESHGCDPVVSP